MSHVLSLSFPRYFPLRTLSVLIVYTENFQLTIIVRPMDEDFLGITGCLLSVHQPKISRTNFACLR